ncbi:hypothetical protein OAK93_01685 [bacterium]|nr:hypothetical protein [bacterium]
MATKASKFRSKESNNVISLISLVYILSSLNLLFNSALDYPIFFFRGVLFYFMIKYIYDRGRRGKVVWVYIPLLLFYLLYGLYNGNFISYVLVDLFGGFVLIFCFYKNNEFRGLAEMIINRLSLLMIIGLICCGYLFFEQGVRAAADTSDRLSFENTGFQGSANTFFIPIQISILILPFILYVNKQRRIIIILASTFFLFVNIVGLNRANLVGCLTAFILTALIVYRDNRSYFSFHRIKYPVLLASIIFVAIASFQSDTISRSFKIIGYRFQDMSDDNSRDLEGELYYTQISNLELIIGKGMGGANNFLDRESERGIMMMHKGENNLMLKGGFILLFLVYGAGFISLWKLIRSKERYSDSWAAVIIIYFLLERGHQQFSNFFYLLLFCVAISFSTNISSKRRKLVSRREKFS